MIQWSSKYRNCFLFRWRCFETTQSKIITFQCQWSNKPFIACSVLTIIIKWFRREWKYRKFEIYLNSQFQLFWFVQYYDIIYKFQEIVLVVLIENFTQNEWWEHQSPDIDASYLWFKRFRLFKLDTDHLNTNFSMNLSFDATRCLHFAILRCWKCSFKIEAVDPWWFLKSLRFNLYALQFMFKFNFFLY